MRAPTCDLNMIALGAAIDEQRRARSLGWIESGTEIDAPFTSTRSTHSIPLGCCDRASIVPMSQVGGHLGQRQNSNPNLDSSRTRWPSTRGSISSHSCGRLGAIGSIISRRPRNSTTAWRKGMVHGVR